MTLVNLLSSDYTFTHFTEPFPPLLLTAANQKEPLPPTFKVKDEPKDEENASSTFPKSTYVFSPEPETSSASLPEENLKPQEVPANVLQQDMSVKAASELLMKLSGTRLVFKIFSFLVFSCEVVSCLVLVTTKRALMANYCDALMLTF